MPIIEVLPDAGTDTSSFPFPDYSGNPNLNITVVVVKWPLNASAPTAYRQVYHDDWYNLQVNYQRRGGYSGFSFECTPELVSEIQADDVVFVYSGPTIIFSGRIEIPELSEPLKENRVVVRGTESILKLKYLESSIGPFDENVSAYWVLNKLIAKLQVAYPNMLVSICSSGEMPELIKQVSCEGQTFFEAFDSFYGDLVNPFCWGIRFNTSQNKWEFYFLRLSSTGGIHRSKYDSAVYEEEYDTTNLASEVLLRGSAAKHPQLWSNPSFENCLRNSQNVQFNEFPLDIAGFENGGWSLSAGASIKSTGDDAGTVEARTGTKILEIDATGEKATYTPAYFTPIVGQWYRFSFWYRPEINASTSTPPIVRCRVVWLNSGVGIIATDQFFCDPQSLKGWFYISEKFQAPSGTVSYRIELEGTSGTFGTQMGLHIDDFRVIRQDMPYPTDWIIEPVISGGTAVVSDYSFDLNTPYHGFIFGRISATISGSSANYVRIRNLQQCEIISGMRVKTSCRLKSVPSTTWPDLAFVCDFYKPGATSTDPPVLISSFESAISIVAPTTWVYTTTEFAAPNGTTFAIAYIKIKNTGWVDIDFLSLRNSDGDQTNDEYDDNVEILRDAATLVPSEPYLSAITNYGPRRAVIEADVDTVANAELAIIAWLKSNVRWNKSPRITEEIQFVSDLPDITQSMRIIEDNIVFPVESIECVFKDMYTKKSSLQFKTPDLADLVNQIKEKGSKFL